LRLRHAIEPRAPYATVACDSPESHFAYAEEF